MPCWYFERKEIKNSPSSLDGIDSVTENRYRREGARFIIDAGTAMGLRYDTCATGVIYFHRFYMFHSFKEFYRYMTAACCLFLAGKVEETPKKCRDIVKIAQSLLSSRSFLRFGEDPREEVITMERILLKTIKFDLQVEHPYSFLLKYAKYFKDKDKEKTQKMAQMAWTFINDSLCTTLCLQWEAEIVAVSLMYLASRLTKFEPSDWIGRNSSKSKWWEDIIEGMSMELMEDICHQVLDLYSSKGKKMLEDSPPQSPTKQSRAKQSPPPPPPDRTPDKRSREATPSEPEPLAKAPYLEKGKEIAKVVTSSNISTPTTVPPPPSAMSGAPIPVAQHLTPTVSNSNRASSSYGSASSSLEPPGSMNDSFTSYNPYVSSSMYTASFMSQEGSQNIQSILAGNTGGAAPPPSAVAATSSQPYPSHSHHHHSLPPPDLGQYPTPPSSVAPQYPQSYLPPPPAAQSQYNTPPPTSMPSHHHHHAYPPPPVPSAAGLPPPPQGYDPYSMPPSYPPATYASGPSPLSMPPLSSSPPRRHSSSSSSSYPPPPAMSQPPYPPSYPPSYPTNPHVPPPQVPPPASSYPPPPSMPPYGSGQLPPNPHHHHHQQGGYGGGHSRSYPKSSPSPAVKPGNASLSQRKDIPALTEIKISGRPEWNLPP